MNWLIKYKQTHCQPSRLIVSGAGIDHDELVGLAKANFGDFVSTPSHTTNSQKQKAVYVGGERYFSAPHAEGLNHIILGWKSRMLNVDSIRVDILM